MQLDVKLPHEGMPVVQLNSPAGDRAAGEVGFAALPGREAHFRESIRAAFEFMKACGSRQLHVVAGIPAQGTLPQHARTTYVRNLQWVADEGAQSDVRIMIEPLNSRDMPGYALATLAQAAEVLAQVARPNVGLQLDLYHTQIMGGRSHASTPPVRAVDSARADCRRATAK